jgi:hypothetical protein
MKYRVLTHGGDDYEVEADRIDADENNTNRVTFFDSQDHVVAQENDTRSVRPA